MATSEPTADRPFFQPRPECDGQTVTARLWRISSRLTVSESGCWVWPGRTNQKGYGAFEMNGRVVLIHRFVYASTVADIPDGLLVMHSCDNPPCCNPSHLSVGDESANIRDCVAKGRHPELKLDDAQADEIRRRAAGAKRGTLPTLAREFGVSVATINRVIHAQSRHHLGQNLHRAEMESESIAHLRSRTPELLRDLRKRFAMTQGEVAKKLGFATSYVSRVETGDRFPCVAFCLALQSMLNQEAE